MYYEDEEKDECDSDYQPCDESFRVDGEEYEIFYDNYNKNPETQIPEYYQLEDDGSVYELRHNGSIAFHTNDGNNLPNLESDCSSEHSESSSEEVEFLPRQMIRDQGQLTFEYNNMMLNSFGNEDIEIMPAMHHLGLTTDIDVFSDEILDDSSELENEQISIPLEIHSPSLLSRDPIEIELPFEIPVENTQPGFILNAHEAGFPEPSGTGQVSFHKLSQEKLTKEENVPKQDCAICQEKYELNQWITILPCQHTFHSHCILTWLHTKRTCPWCRGDVIDAQNPSREEEEEYEEEEIEADDE